MATFVFFSDTSNFINELEEPKKFLENRLSDHKISGLFFYSDSVNEFLNKVRLDAWLELSLTQEIPIFACRNSLIKRNIPEKINPLIKVVGLGKFIEEVLRNKKTMVIGGL